MCMWYLYAVALTSTCTCTCTCRCWDRLRGWGTQQHRRRPRAHVRRQRGIHQRWRHPHGVTARCQRWSTAAYRRLPPGGRRLQLQTPATDLVASCVVWREHGESVWCLTNLCAIKYQQNDTVNLFSLFSNNYTLSQRQGYFNILTCKRVWRRNELTL